MCGDPAPHIGVEHLRKAGRVLKQFHPEVDIPRRSPFLVQCRWVAAILSPGIQIVTPREKLVLADLAITCRVELGAAKIDRVVSEGLRCTAMEIKQWQPRAASRCSWEMRPGLKASHACVLHESGANLFQRRRENAD